LAVDSHITLSISCPAAARDLFPCRILGDTGPLIARQQAHGRIALNFAFDAMAA
jgi:hypothetical protein